MGLCNSNSKNCCDCFFTKKKKRTISFSSLFDENVVTDHVHNISNKKEPLDVVSNDIQTVLSNDYSKNPLDFKDTSTPISHTRAIVV